MNSSNKASLRVKLALVAGVIAMSATSCTSSKGTPTPDQTVTQSGEPALRNRIIRSDYATGEVTKLCQAAIDDAKASFDQIAAVPAAQRTFDNTMLAFENANADFGDKTNGLTFMGYVSTNADVSAEGSACEEKVGAFMVETYTRRDLYDALRAPAARDADEARLQKEAVHSFVKNGLNLNDADLAKLKGLLALISKNEAKFSANLNADATFTLFTDADLAGCPADFLARLKKDASGKYIVTTKSTDYLTVAENATNPATRKANLVAYLNRGGAENTKLLEETTVLRAQAATLLGYKSWADYQIDGRMAGSRQNVVNFLNDLKGRLAKRNQSDYDELLKYKKQIDPKAIALDQWDVAFASRQLMKRDYSVDEEAIKEYFPADVVVAGMFDVYSKLLGVTFKEVANADVWNSDVKMYEIRDAASDRRIGYFYADFVPREGKYGHAAAFTLVSGRSINGRYNEPVSSIVANFAPPTPGKPSLLPHDDVETIFHEFGHIMHQTLTRAKYASLSGSNVAQDFVEAPSQMLENWVWSPEILPMLSGHYLDHTKKLPQVMLDKMLAARNFGQGIAYTKQLLYALFDIEIHSGAGANDVTKTYDDLYRQIVGQEPLQGAHFAGTFGHMMGGYDAGYYGYLWSEVYAQDMFTKFEDGGLLSPVVGARYRTDILERGGMKEALENLKDFLGRDPNSDAFFKKLGL